MKTYKQLFSEIETAALIPFFVIGDPDLESSFQFVKSAIDAGADILELGIPFSDPIADGRTIQKADIRAANSGMNLQKAREFIKRVKNYKDIPLGLLMYYNLVYQYGTEKFFKEFHQAGVNSILIADLSIDDADEVLPVAKSCGLDTVFMVTPNTAEKRIQLIASKTTGFIYTVSVLGVTGSRNELSDVVEELISRLKKMTTVPVCVGFGISRPEHAAAVASANADGVIIGSALIKMIEANLDNPEKAASQISQFIRNVKAAIKEKKPKRG